MGYFRKKLRRGRIRDAVRQAAAEVDPFAESEWQQALPLPPDRRYFVRFSTALQREDSGCREGIFQAGWRVARDRTIRWESTLALRELLRWVGDHVPVPPPDFDVPEAIFLFRSDAHECMQRMWDLVHHLAALGVHCEMQVVEDPGLVVWEDEFQVAVVPNQRRKGM